MRATNGNLLGLEERQGSVSRNLSSFRPAQQACQQIEGSEGRGERGLAGGDPLDQSAHAQLEEKATGWVLSHVGFESREFGSCGPGQVS